MSNRYWYGLCYLGTQPEPSRAYPWMKLSTWNSFQYKNHLSRYKYSHNKGRTPWDCLTFKMGVPMLVRRYLYFETLHWFWCVVTLGSTSYLMNIWRLDEWVMEASTGWGVVTMRCDKVAYLGGTYYQLTYIYEDDILASLSVRMPIICMAYVGRIRVPWGLSMVAFSFSVYGVTYLGDGLEIRCTSGTHESYVYILLVP